MKTLTDIVYTEYVEKMEALFADEKPDIEVKEPEVIYAPYSKEDFLKDVFMTEERYVTLKGLLKRQNKTENWIH